MADTKTQTSVAAELRAAAEKLRETAKAATPGDWDVHHSGELVAWQDTEDQRCDYLADGADWANDADPEWIALASPLLGEPLAALLEEVVEEAGEHEILADHREGVIVRFCRDCETDDCVGIRMLDRALAVVHALNGTSQREVSVRG